MRTDRFAGPVAAGLVHRCLPLLDDGTKDGESKLHIPMYLAYSWPEYPVSWGQKSITG